jgi:tyrosine-protein phosphatase SIW14
MRKFPFNCVLLVLLTAMSARPQTKLAAAPVAPQAAEKINVPGIHNAGKINDWLYRGAQPSHGELAQLKKLGITTVVDLRRESRQIVEHERAQAKSLGLRFISIPVGGFSTPSALQLAEFFSLLRETPPQKIFVHCEYGADRTGMFVASYRIAFENWTPEQALSEMLAFGFNRIWHPGMERFVRELPARLVVDPALRAALGTPQPGVVESH